MVTMQEIKRKYPKPVAAMDEDLNFINDSPDKYCVGGAVCMFSGYFTRVTNFPQTYSLSKALIYLNKNLSPDQATDFAISIIDNNDNQYFATAWQYVRKALEYEGEK